jgi:hypothetical protein
MKIKNKKNKEIKFKKKLIIINIKNIEKIF